MELPLIRVINLATDSGTNITAAKVLPVADFSSSVTNGYAPFSVQFTDKSQNAETWNWDFGDGGKSTEQNPAYVYNIPGPYVAKLTVRNANGSDSKTATINVLQASSSGGGGSIGGSGHSSGGSIGNASVVGSSETVNSSTANATQPETNTSNIGPSSKPVTVEPTAVPAATTTPAKQSKRTSGFEMIFGITALLGAVYLYRRR